MNLTLKVWRQTGPLSKGSIKTYSADNIPAEASFLEMLDIVNGRIIQINCQSYMEYPALRSPFPRPPVWPGGSLNGLNPKSKFLAFIKTTLTLAALGFIFVVAGATRAADKPADEKGLEAEQSAVLARGELQLSAAAHPKGVQLVIRDEKSLAELLDTEDGQKAVAQAAAALGVKTVNFEQEMLIAVSAGPVRGPLLRLYVSRLPVAKDQMRVEWAITRMMEHAAAPLRHPVRLVLVKTFSGEVVFLPPSESRR